MKTFWREREKLHNMFVYYLNRGSPGDISSFSGERIKHIGRSFIELNSLTLPYHRILKIEIDGKVIWERRKEDQNIK